MRVRVLVHREPFEFEGVDCLTILGKPLDRVKTPIPFTDPLVDERVLDLPYNQVPGLDFVHRFRDLKGGHRDFLMHEECILSMVFRWGDGG